MVAPPPNDERRSRRRTQRAAMACPEVSCSDCGKTGAAMLTCRWRQTEAALRFAFQFSEQAGSPMSRASLAEAPAGCQEAQRLLQSAGAPAEALAPASSRPTRTPSFLRVANVDGALTSRDAAKAAAGAIADALAATGVAVFSGGVAAEAIAAVRLAMRKAPFAAAPPPRLRRISVPRAAAARRLHAIRRRGRASVWLSRRFPLR